MKSMIRSVNVKLNVVRNYSTGSIIQISEGDVGSSANFSCSLIDVTEMQKTDIWERKI